MTSCDCDQLLACKRRVSARGVSWLTWIRSASAAFWAADRIGYSSTVPTTTLRLILWPFVFDSRHRKIQTSGPLLRRSRATQPCDELSIFVEPEFYVLLDTDLNGCGFGLFKLCLEEWQVVVSFRYAILSDKLHAAPHTSRPTELFRGQNMRCDFP